MKRGMVIVGAAVCATVLAVPTAAQAQDVDFTFDAPTTVQVEYGAQWQVTGTTLFEFMVYPTLPGHVPTVVSQNPDFPDPAFYTYSDPTNTINAKMVFMPSTTAAPLPVGDYDIDLALDTIGYGDTPYHARATGATLTVVPAALTPSVTLTPDATASGGLVVNGQLTGAYTDFVYQNAYAPNIPIMPAGVWSFVVKDAQGSVVLEKTVDDPAGGPPSTSFYWNGASAGEDYTASVDFVVDGGASGNFAVAPGAPTSARTDVPVRDVPVADAPAPEPVVTSSGFSVPVWAVILAALAFLALAVALVIILVRGRRPAGPAVARPALTKGSSL